MVEEESRLCGELTVDELPEPRRAPDFGLSNRECPSRGIRNDR